MADNKLLRFAPEEEEWPSVTEVANGNVRVYWHASQGIEVDEPPNYAAPTEWPVADTLLRRPRAMRVITDEAGEGETCDVVYVSYTGYTSSEFIPGTTQSWEAEVSIESGGYCECNFDAEEVLYTQAFEEGNVDLTQAELADVSFMNNLFRTNTIAGASGPAEIDIYSGRDIVVQSEDGCEGEGGGSSEWTDIVTAQAVPAGVSKLSATGSGANYLACISVHADDVPADADDYSFIGGEVLNVLVFSTDTGLDTYDPETVLASDAAVRIAAAFPLFKKYRVAFVADKRGEISTEFCTQLAAIAEALAPYGFAYTEIAEDGDPATVLASIVAAFYT